MSENQNPTPDVAQEVVDAANDAARSAPGGGGLDMLMGVALNVTVELGRTRMPIQDILSMATGSVIELDKLASEPVDIFVNETLVAQGEVVVVEDHFSVKITQVLDSANGVTS